jgi:hypothetical protein
LIASSAASIAEKFQCRVEHIYSFVLGHHVRICIFTLCRAILVRRASMGGVHVDEWPDAPHGGPNEIADLCTRLRTHLQSEEHSSR